MLTFYRKTIKHVRPLHLAIHRLISGGVLPLMEKFTGFRTMPDDPFWFRLELLTGKHERETMQHLKRMLKPGMTFLDIGAHVGYYARRCSPLVGEKGRVVAFEPHPRTFQTLRHNTQSLKNIILMQVAVAEKEGTAELYDYLMMSASGSLHYDEHMLDLQKAHLSQSDVAPRIARDFPVQKYSVQTRPLDVCLAEQGIEKVDVVKMDIEGAEIGALRGMRETIARSPGLALIMEYNPQALIAFGFEPEAALEEVMGMGFSRVQAIERDGTLTDFSENKTAIAERTAQLSQNMGVVNLLFSQDEKASY